MVQQYVPSIDLEMSRQFQDVNRLDYDGPKIWKYFLKNWPIISQPVTLLFLFLLMWIIGRVLFPSYTIIDAVLMRMIVLFIGAQMCGIALKLLQMPEMLGMLGFGVFFTNMGWANFDGYSELETFLRELALVNIMILAGLGIDLKLLSKQFQIVSRLSILPTAVEIICITVIAHFTLDMTWLWGLLLGLVVTAVSPNVVVDIIIWLNAEKYGLYKGIHTIIIAVTTCSDVISIFFFGVVLGILFSTGPLSEQLLQGPIGIAIGIVYGFLFGLFVSIVPSKKSNYTNGLRFLLVLFGGILSVVGSKAIGFPTAGALGCVVISCIANLCWKHQKYSSDDINVKFNLLWKFVKPISFALIGKEVNFEQLDAKIVGFGLIIVIAGSMLRLLVAYASAYGADLNWKEKIYVTISGFPKATVQAALGPVALDLARKYKPELSDVAHNVLIVSVLAIILTAPIGAVLMVKLAPILLKQSPNTSNQT